MLRVGCPNCGSADFSSRRIPLSRPPTANHRCNTCGHSWSGAFRARDVVVAVLLGVILIAALGLAAKVFLFS